MGLRIEFSDRAKKTADEIYDFIEENFGEKEAIAFKSKTGKTLNTMCKFPYMFKASNLGEDIRVGLITEQTSVLYQIHEDFIHLHFFWDNRQEPFL